MPWRTAWTVLCLATVSSAAAPTRPRPLLQDDPATARADALERARANAAFAQEAFGRARLYLSGWMAHADPATGMLPRNVGKDADLWVPADSGADNEPWYVVSAALLDPPLFDSTMPAMLANEERLTSRLGVLPDTWSFSKSGFVSTTPNPDAIVFGACEYAEDGLLAVTEWLGKSPWSERLLAVADDVEANARFDCEVGRLPFDSYRANGEMLQVYCRAYWLTGEERYLDDAVRIGDHYLLSGALPTRASGPLRLRNEVSELIAGLGELYVTVASSRPERAQTYRPPLHEAWTRLLAVGRNDDGLFYDQVDPSSGTHVDGIADTFGRILSGIYDAWLVDGERSYQDAVRTALGALASGYRDFAWEGTSANGYADAIGGTLVLARYEHVEGVDAWLESQAQVLWSKQGDDGLVEGWHGDGSFARACLMLGLWKTCGARLEPWREDVALGAALDGDALVLVATAEEPWKGRLVLDTPRHRLQLHLPVSYPRTNERPEWFPVESDLVYRVAGNAAGGPFTANGAALAAGVPVTLAPGQELRWVIEAAP